MGKLTTEGLGEAAAVWVDIDSLRPWGGNPRKVAEKHIAQVVESMKRFGFGAPILARPDGEIIAGHTRWAAAKKLGLDRAPVRHLDLDPADAHLLAVADNKLTEDGEWDDALLAELLGPLMMRDEDAALVAGFSDKEIAALLKTQADAVLEPAEDQTDQLGSRYEVIVECGTEAEQVALLERLMGEGRKCRALI